MTDNILEAQRRLRIRVSLFAYAYEMMDVSLIPDAEFDTLCLQVNPEIDTGHPVTDAFFRKEFNPSTGMWIHAHPEIEGIKRIYDTLANV